jgi:hypothetical protein
VGGSREWNLSTPASFPLRGVTLEKGTEHSRLLYITGEANGNVIEALPPRLHYGGEDLENEIEAFQPRLHYGGVGSRELN